jgi:REP element-mobilizing transposase RayT
MEPQYPSRLHHGAPSWVADGSVFHVRIRCAKENPICLTQPDAAESLLESVRVYADTGRWFSHLFLFMPDHAHALLSFPKDEVMARVIGDWKRYQSGNLGVLWQDNFFDHRIRNTREHIEKAAYIRQNPVVKGLCARPEDWPWVI